MCHCALLECFLPYIHPILDFVVGVVTCDFSLLPLSVERKSATKRRKKTVLLPLLLLLCLSPTPLCLLLGVKGNNRTTNIFVCRAVFFLMGRLSCRATHTLFAGTDSLSTLAALSLFLVL